MATADNTPTRSAPHQSTEKRSELKSALSGAAETLKASRKLRFTRHARQRDAKPARLFAYDFETDNIKAGTPRPRYLTAYGHDFAIEARIDSMQKLRDILLREFLTMEKKGSKFVAWNGNRFDAYFIAAALVREDQFTLRPYMTKSKTIRGLRVSLKYKESGIAYDDDERPPSWEFVDGIAMLGLAGTSLSEFLKNFAPDHLKLTGVIDFDKEEFDADNPKHREYAMRDSVGLWHGMMRAQEIMLERFNEPLSVTMGGVCVKIFQANIPPETVVEPCEPDALQVIRHYALRGGYCHLARPFHGPIWKYDLNQAYCAAMRETDLPCGSMVHVYGAPSRYEKCFMARITAHHSTNEIPFYYRSSVGGRVKSLFSAKQIHDTWVTSAEYRQLQAEKWTIVCAETWIWGGTFRMHEFVDKLETLRTTCEGGPKGAIGTMVKATGNHSFGKTAEVIEPIDYIIAAECPPDCVPFYSDDGELIEHVFYRIVLDRRPKPYHHPQIAAFITAHVRMVVRRAALIDPASWIYADTDCVVFTRDVTRALDIDVQRYGAWKVEDTGTVYRFIAKKVYAQDGGEKPKHSAKGMNVRRLTPQDFARWYEGAPPVQDQIQVQNFLAVLSGAEMFRAQRRKGTRVKTPAIESAAS